MSHFLNFFKSDDFMPHGHCFLWQKNILLLHVLSDAGIAIAYYLIPVLLFYLIRHRKDLPYKPLFTAFSTFILLCGTTHLLSIWVLWYPDYAIEGTVKAATAVVSLATLFILWRIVPQALRLIVPADVKESTEQFQFLVNTLPQLAWMADAAGWIFWYNDRWYEYTGTEKKDMEGWGWQSVHDPKTLPLVLETWQSSIATGKPFEMVFPLKAKDGMFRPFLTRIVPVRDKQNKITRWFGTNTDITDQISAEEKAIEALRVSQEGLELGWQGAGNGMWDWDTLSNKLNFSDRMLELMGFAPGELPSHIEEWSSRLHPDDKARTMAMLEAHLKDGKTVYEAEYRLRTKSGDWRWFLAQGQAKWDERGNVTRMAGSLIDIHERKKAAEERERLIALIEESVDFIGMADIKGNLLYHNRSAKRIIGLPEDSDLSGLKMSDMHPPWANKLITEEALPSVFKTGAWLGETALLHRDGREIPVLQNLALHRDSEGEPLYFTTIMRDFSEHKALERMKDEFVSTVSHELRTPLTSIRGSLGLIIGGKAGAMPPQARHLVDIAYKNCDRLILIINDILDLESIEAGLMQFNLKWEDLETLLTQAADLNRPYGDKLNVKFSLHLPAEAITVNVDGSRFSQIISNLLSNAAKFSPDGGTVHIRTEERGSNVRIFVADQGPGIPEEFQTRIFNKFAQADSSDSKTKGGTGLGLNITKAMVERMGGKIGFTTAADTGTTFTIDFPTSKANARLSDPERILICEDDDSIAQLLKMTLEDYGFRAEIAANALQAGLMLAKNTYIAMTLDLILPDKNGLDFYRELRAQEKTSDLPIIVISAKANEGKTALNGSAIGIVDWLVKPIDFDRLLKAVDRLSRKTGLPTVLHVEDDMDIAQIMALKLQASANVIHAKTLEEAKQLLLTKDIHLLIIDIGLPDGSGLNLMEFNMQNNIIVPIVILSASEVPGAITGKVAATFIKAKSSEERIFGTIFTLLEAQKNMQ